MPEGKPAGTRCIQLDSQNRCLIFSDPGRPPVCASLQPSATMCGEDPLSAMIWLNALEAQTRPA